MNEGILENNTTAENDETEAMNINSAIESANNAEKGANMETGTGRIKDAAKLASGNGAADRKTGKNSHVHQTQKPGNTEKTSGASKRRLRRITESEMEALPDEELLRMGQETIDHKLSDDKKFMDHFNADFNSYRLEKQLKDRGYKKITTWVSCNSGNQEINADVPKTITLHKPEAPVKRRYLSIPDDGTYEKYMEFSKALPYQSEVTRLALTSFMDEFDKGKIEFRFGK